MGEQGEGFEPELEFFRRDGLSERAASVLAGEVLRPLAFEPARRAAAVGKQHAGFLESLADRRDAHHALPVVEAGRGDVAVAGIDGAAGKHQRARSELDLPVALDHENLEPARSVAHHQHGGGKAGGRGFGHCQTFKQDRTPLRGRWR